MTRAKTNATKQDKHAKVAKFEAEAKRCKAVAEKLRNEIAHEAAHGTLAGAYRKHPAMLSRHEGDHVWTYIGQATNEQHQTVYVLRRENGWMRVVSSERLLTDYLRAPAPKRGKK